jgi:Fe-S-cluster formation regulator IscX/YfhJ
MSLKTEQRIIGKQITEFEPRIYSTGVHLVPLKVEFDGIERFIWAVDEFNDDSYFDGKNISPKIFSNKIEEMYVESLYKTLLSFHNVE